MLRKHLANILFALSVLVFIYNGADLFIDHVMPRIHIRAASIEEEGVTYCTHNEYLHVSIPSVGLEEAVHLGGTQEDADAYPVFMVPNHLPGEGQPLVMGGHNYGPFKKLEKVKENDTIRLISPEYVYVYQVKSIEICDTKKQRHHDHRQYREKCPTGAWRNTDPVYLLSILALG